jgi:flagellar biosynthetic protein FlhB
MAGDAGEKSEAPTPRRRTEARDKGQIARSQELNAAVTLLGAMLLLKLWGDGVWQQLQQLASSYLGEIAPTVRVEEMVPLIFHAANVLVKAVLPFMIGVFVMALLVAYAQTGWLLTGETIKPSLAKINPLTGIKRILSARSLVQLLTNVAKLVLIGLVAYWTISQRFNDIVLSMELGIAALFKLGSSIIFSLTIRLGFVLLVLAVIDYVYQRYKHEKDLKMTKEEVKEEMRRMEGDPTMKRRRMEVQRQLSLQRMRTEVPKADVVITNPTELAIAIKYDPDKMGAPRVLAKGADYMAMQIRKIAIEFGVPIVEKKPLAQAIYRAVEVGQEIPTEFYKAIAEILAYVYELSGKRRPSGVA